MSSARVDDDIQIVEEGSNGGSQQHIEPEIIINPGGSGSGSGSEPGNDVNAGHAEDRSGSEGGQHHSSEQNHPALLTVVTPGRCMATAVSRATSLKTWGLGPVIARYRQGCLPVEEPETTDPELQAPQTDVRKPERGWSWLLWV
jgi:hypothetical protein